MMHLLVQKAQEPLLLLPLAVQLSTCLNPFFWYYMALLHEKRNWISFTAWVPPLLGDTTGTGFWIQAALCTELIEKSTCFFKLKAHHSYTFFINTRISWKPSKKNAVCLHSHTSRFIIWCYQKSKNLNPMAFSVFVHWICSWVSSKRLLFSVRLFLLQLRLAFPIVSHRAFRGTTELHTYISFSAVVIMHKSIPAMPIAPSTLGQHLALEKKRQIPGGEEDWNKSVKCP